MTGRRIVGLVLLVLGLVGAVMAALAFLGQRHNYENYGRAVAVLAESAAVGKPGGSPPGAAAPGPMVSFRNVGGDTVVAPLDTGPFQMDPQVRNGRVRVRYDRANPQTVILDHPLAMYGASFAVGGGALILLIVAGLLRRRPAVPGAPRGARPKPAPTKGKGAPSTRSTASARAAAPDRAAPAPKVVLDEAQSAAAAALRTIAVERRSRGEAMAGSRGEPTIQRSEGGPPGLIIMLALLAALLAAVVVLLGASR